MEITLQEYERQFQAFMRSASQTKLIAQIAGELLTDFPQRLPPEVRQRLAKDMRSWVSKGPDLAKARMKEPGQKVEMEWPSDDLLEATLSVLQAQFFAHRHETTKLSMPNFRSLIYEQELVMLVAQLEAFFSESVRAMCVAEPRVLRREKALTWSEVLDCESLQGVMKRMIEAYTFELGLKSLAERFKHLKEKHGVEIALKEEDLQYLDEIEALRHVIVHNGGRVSQEYLKRTGRSDVKIGDVISVDADFREIANLSVRICGLALFAGIRGFLKCKLGDSAAGDRETRDSVAPEFKSR